MGISAWKPVLVPFHPSASRAGWGVLSVALIRRKILRQLVLSLYPSFFFWSSMKAAICPKPIIIWSPAATFVLPG